MRTQLLAFRLKSDMIERRARALDASSLAIGVAAGLTPLAHTQTHTHTLGLTHTLTKSTRLGPRVTTLPSKALNFFLSIPFS